jgi:hypothetical protein
MPSVRILRLNAVSGGLETQFACRQASLVGGWP